MDLSTLFLDHLRQRQTYLEEALAKTGFDSLVISSGQPFTYFADDADAPFRTIPHFRHYCPLTGPHHVLVLAPGRKPKLVRYAPEDFWFEQMSLEATWGGTPFWAAGFDLVEVPTLEAVWAAVGHPERSAYIGNETEPAAQAGLALNPANLTTYLDWGRAYKSDYEIHSMQEASVVAGRAHEAGRRVFLAGGTELDIHHAYIQAAGCLDFQLAFSSIVALNEKGATLHYENKRTVGNGLNLLLDCGARVRDYASDITRTYVTEGCDPDFKALVQAMDRMQQHLCTLVRPGRPFGELHVTCHRMTAEILKEAGLLKVGADEALAKGFTRPFMPHGLGHHLGIEVHDVGGKLADPSGTFQAPPVEYPNLRTTRTLEAGQVVTIEPGLYFIPMLLRPFREGEHAAHFNWAGIDRLSACGGIRIEDDMVCTEGEPVNLTRAHCPQ